MEVEREAARIMEREEWENQMREKEKELEQKTNLLKMKGKNWIMAKEPDQVRMQATRKARKLEDTWGVEAEWYRQLDAWSEGWEQGKKERKEEEERRRRI